MTILPFHNKPDTELINGLISQVAASEKVDLFDIYTPYKNKMDQLGRNNFTVRFIALSDIPENYRTVIAPFTKYYDWKKADWVRVQTNEFDALFGDLAGWYKDPHPNTAGYRLIADETAKYMIQRLSAK